MASPRSWRSIAPPSTTLDAALVHLLAERFRCTQQVGLLKAQLDLPPADPGREREQVARLRALAEESGLDPVFAEKFFAFIVAEVIQHHEEIRDDHEAERASQSGLPDVLSHGF